MSTAFELRPIEPLVADRLRVEWANAPIHVADEHPGYPCRQCLNDAEIGEELLLVSYDPFRSTAPSGRRARSSCIARRAYRPPTGKPFLGS
jgi:Protein of unknown function (DUF1203)